MAKQPPVLTEQELEIMKVVWERESVTVRDVYETLRPSADRLHDRDDDDADPRAEGAREGQPGRSGVRLSSRAARQRVLGEMVREFVDRVFGGAAEPLVQHLVRDRHLTEDDLREIAAHLKSRKSEGNDER